jgi:hypothetical protein
MLYAVICIMMLGMAALGWIAYSGMVSSQTNREEIIKTRQLMLERTEGCSH